MGVGHGMVLAGWLGMALAAHAQGAAPAPAPPRLTILTEHSPPVSMFEHGASGKIVGTGGDKVRELMARSGVAFTMEMQPWKRAYTAALDRPDTCVFSTTRLPEREHLFKWIGPTDSGSWILLGLADRQFAFKTLDDARSLRIGTYNGDARDAYLRERGFKVDPAQNDLINVQKLLLGRIDLWASSMRDGTRFLKTNGWDERIVPVLAFKKIDVYLACNRTLPDALVARMNAALDAMRRDGTAKKIDRLYENWHGPD